MTDVIDNCMFSNLHFNLNQPIFENIFLMIAELSQTSKNETVTEQTVVSLPQKRFYRQRAHSNPIADHCFD